MSISIRRTYKTVPILVLITAAGSAGLAQTPPAPATPAPSSNTTGPALAGLRPVLSQVGDAVGNLRIMRWKAPVDLRESTQADVSSIQRDLSVTLPPLLDQAQTSSSPAGPLAPSFTIFRNIDALYDVLLRVTEMANLAGSGPEAAQLETARGALESARGQLGSALLESVTAQDTQLAHFRAEAAAPPKPVPAVAPTKTIVDDGPQVTPKHRATKKKPTTPPAAPPSPQ